MVEKFHFNQGPRIIAGGPRKDDHRRRVNDLQRTRVDDPNRQRQHILFEILIAGCIGGRRRQDRRVARNGKGRDIGYAPAASSCEGANNVDACTITALDVITAFAVPNPNGSSQSPSVFSGLVVLQVALLNGSPSLLRSD